MISGKIPKTRNNPVGKCPNCRGNLFEEVSERSYGDPGNETVFFEKFLACGSCRYCEDIEN